MQLYRWYKYKSRYFMKMYIRHLLTYYNTADSLKTFLSQSRFSQLAHSIGNLVEMKFKNKTLWKHCRNIVETLCNTLTATD